MTRTASDEVREEGSVSQVRSGRAYVPHKEAGSTDSIQSLSRVRLFATPRTAARQTVHHQLPEFIQTHVHGVDDVIHHLILCWVYRLTAFKLGKGPGAPWDPREQGLPRGRDEGTVSWGSQGALPN